MPPTAALPPWLEPLRRQALAHQRGHALLVHGPAGVGHFEFAVGLAAAWLCEAPDRSAAPCGQCAACRLLAAHTHPDLFVAMPEEHVLRLGWRPAEEGGDAAPAEDGGRAGKKKPSRELKVDAVRAATAWAASTASRGRLKVIVLHPAEAMNVVAANALLKTLEEPSASVRLLLTAQDPERLLPTIRSRCQKLRIALPAPADALAWLEGQGVADAPVLLAAAGGGPLEARDLAAEGLDAAFWRRLPQAVAAGDARPLSGLPLPRVIEALQKLCHDAMAVAQNGAPRYLDPQALKAGASLAALTGWSRELLRVARHDEHPWNAALLVDSLVSMGRQALFDGSGAKRRSVHSSA